MSDHHMTQDDHGMWYCRLHENHAFSRARFRCAACAAGLPPDETRAAVRGPTTSAAFAHRAGGFLSPGDYGGQELYVDARLWAAGMVAADRPVRH